MNPIRSHHLFIALVALLASLFDLPAHAQETETESLTFQQFPSRFHSRNPLTPTSEIMIQFSQPVLPDSTGPFLFLYDKPNERLVEVTASRPKKSRIKTFLDGETLPVPADHFVLIQPTSPLPLNGTWYLNVRTGLKSSDGKHQIVESHLDYIGSLNSFEIDEIDTYNPYNDDSKIVIRHNKSYLNPIFDSAKLSEFISISPRPENFSIEATNYQIQLLGDFDYGTTYEVALKDGIIANDKTQLAQSFKESTSFKPNEGFVTYPAYSTTQNATGHRRFDVKTGNLTGLRTRVKRLNGDNLILALREYSEKYEGWGEKETLPFTSVPGKQIYDQFRGAEAEIDNTETISLQWDDLTEKSKTGAFYLCSEGQSATREKLAVGAQSIIQLTDIGLAWKQSSQGTLVYGFSLQSGTPLSGLSLRLVDENAAEITTAQTGDDGIAQFEPDSYLEASGQKFLDASLGTDRHVIQFHEELNSLGLWKFSVSQRWDEIQEGERRTLVFTDRNVYKPGDEVKIKAISRFVDEDKLLGAGTGSAVLKILDPRHRKILERDINFGQSGSFDDTFTLPTAGLGWYSVEIDFNPKDTEDDSNWRLFANHSFQVEEYRVNTFEIDIATEDSYDAEQPFEIPVSAKYYMGKPLSKAELQWNLYAYLDYPRPRGFDDFDFGDLDEGRSTHSADGTLPLSGKGSATVKFSLPEQTTSPGPRSVTLTTQVTDANQQTISNTKRFTVHSSDYYLGIGQPDGVHRAGDTAIFSIAAVSPEGEAFTTPVDATVLVEKEIWNTVKVMGANGRMTHRQDKRLQTISETSTLLETKTDPESGLTHATPYPIAFREAGDFVITLTSRDSQNRPVITRTEFTVIGAEEPSWSWYDVIRIDLTPDKNSYGIGDTAKVLARTPVFGSALLTTERGGVRSTRSITIDQYETILDIPIEEGDAPNIFASLLIIRGSGESPHIHTSADYRLGYCELKVDDPASHLTVNLDKGESEYYQPGEIVDISAQISDHLGNPISGSEVTLFAVDEGVLSLTGHKTPDPHHVFHEEFPLSIFTGQSLSDLLPENPLEQDFSNKGYVIGGGGANQGIDPNRVRKDFKALAFWEPSLLTDSDGRVTTSFVAPDNLTTFRLMAVASKGNRFGHNESPVVINKPLIIEPALPGFTNITDQIDVAAVLHNNTGRTQEIEINVHLDEHAVFIGTIGDKVPTSQVGSESTTLRTATAFLEPGATETVSFPIALTSVGEAKWNWNARSRTDTTLRDATESTLQVGYPLPLLRESHSFMIRDGRSLENALQAVDPRLLEGNGNVELTLSNSRLVNAVDALDYLLQYPYGCVEQTTSSLIPWLSTSQLRQVMPQLDKSEEETEAIIKKGIDRLFSMQTSDGGLGYWPGSTQSMLWGSAYGGIAIALAQQQGIDVPEGRAKSLWDYLSKNLRNSADAKDTYDLSQRCLASYSLALAGVNETSYHEVLFNKQKQLPAEARALLALAMIESGTDTPDKVEILLSNDPKVPVSEVSWYKQPYIAATRLLAEVRHNPGSDRVDSLVDELMKLRQPRRGWGSTYSNAWPLIALAEYSNSEAATLSANEIDIALGDESSQISLPGNPGSGNATFSFDGSIKDKNLTVSPLGAAPVYATLTIATRPELAPLEPENRGFSIKRIYQKVETDGSISEAHDLQVGDLILITLDINLPAGKENYIAIDDPLPAIFEGVNPTFKSQATQRVNRERKSRTLYANFRELQKDRMLFFADYISREGDYSLQYLARVVAPGEVTAPPAKIEAMYEPQRFGLSGTERISARALPLKSDKVALR